jgi:hypothetical protein
MVCGGVCCVEEEMKDYAAENQDLKVIGSIP